MNYGKVQQNNHTTLRNDAQSFISMLINALNKLLLSRGGSTYFKHS